MGGGWRRKLISEAAADAEALAVRHFHLQRARHALIFPLARQVADHDRFGVLPGLQLQQHVAAPGEIGRVGAVQHQAFAARAYHGIELLFQRGAVGHARLLDDLQPGHGGVGNQRAASAGRVR